MHTREAVEPSQPFVVHVPGMIAPGALNPAAYNPRKITPEKYEALKANILAEGFVEPVVVQKKGSKIIGGHQRVRAVKEICIEAGSVIPEIPCVVLDIDDVRAKKLNIKLNALTGDFEARLLGELLIDIYEAPIIVPEEAMLLGLEPLDAQKYMRLIEPLPEVPRSEEPSGFARSVTLSLDFDSVDERNTVKKILQERSEVEKKKTGSIVAAFLAPRRAKQTPVKASGKKRVRG